MLNLASASVDMRFLHSTTPRISYASTVGLLQQGAKIVPHLRMLRPSPQRATLAPAKHTKLT